MKKTYINPMVKVVAIRTVSVMAGSPQFGLDSTNKVNGSAALGRQDNSWDFWGSGDDEE